MVLKLEASLTGSSSCDGGEESGGFGNGVRVSVVVPVVLPSPEVVPAVSEPVVSPSPEVAPVVFEPVVLVPVLVVFPLLELPAVDPAVESLLLGLLEQALSSRVAAQQTTTSDVWFIIFTGKLFLFRCFMVNSEPRYL